MSLPEQTNTSVHGAVVVAETNQDVHSVLHECHDKLVVVDYFAPWCQPCVRFSPVFETMAKDHASKAVFMKVDIEKIPEAAEAAQVNTLPTFIIFYNGRKQDRCEGALKEKLEEMITKVTTNLNI